MKSIQLSTLLKDKAITNIYTGRESGCRCGCNGTYWKPGDKGFARAFNKAKGLDPVVDIYGWNESASDKAYNEHIQNEFNGRVHAVGQLAPALGSGAWVDICTGNGKTITIYWK